MYHDCKHAPIVVQMPDDDPAYQCTKCGIVSIYPVQPLHMTANPPQVDADAYRIALEVATDKLNNRASAKAAGFLVRQSR